MARSHRAVALWHVATELCTGGAVLNLELPLADDGK